MESWMIGIVLDSREVSTCVAATIAELVAMAETSGRLAVVAIDIPTGLPDDGAARRTGWLERSSGRSGDPCS